MKEKPVVIRRPPPPASLRPYPDICKAVKESGLTLHLSYFYGYWTLEVMERYRVVVSVRSREEAPAVFAALARLIREDLEDASHSEGERS